MSFKYDPKQIIIEKLTEYLKELKSDKFNGVIKIKYWEGNAYDITEIKKILKNFTNNELESIQIREKSKSMMNDEWFYKK